jgi:hypothetical protein
MSHYTLRSGIATATVSLRCPQCLALRNLHGTMWADLTRRPWAPPEQLYCNEVCQKAHVETLIKATRRVCRILTKKWRNALQDLQDGFIPVQIATKLANNPQEDQP